MISLSLIIPLSLIISLSLIIPLSNYLSLSLSLSLISRERCPLLCRHLDHYNLTWDLLVTKWFVCLYAEVLPIEVRWGGAGGPSRPGDLSAESPTEAGGGGVAAAAAGGGAAVFTSAAGGDGRPAGVPPAP